MSSRFIIFLAGLLIGITTVAQEEKKKFIEFHGYVKDMQVFAFSGGFDSASWVNLIHNRMNIKANFSERLTARLELRNRIFYGSQVRDNPEFGETINAYPGNVDLSKLWVDTGSLVIQSVIDRLLLKYNGNKWDLTVGRQRINWGINTIWNPNDIFNAYNFLDFDYEERPGNDAVRLQFYPTDNHSWELAIKPGRHPYETIAALLYKFNRKKYDYQVLGGVYNADVVAGLGWAGSIGNKGFKGEFSYFHPQQHFFDSSGTVSASVMMDYTFKNNWYVSGSFLFNSSPFEYFSTGGIFSANISAKSLFPFRYSFYGGFTKAFSPVLVLNAAVVYSPDHNSLILFPALAYNAGPNLDLDLTIQSFFADNGQAYKSQGSALYIRGKWSF